MKHNTPMWKLVKKRVLAELIDAKDAQIKLLTDRLSELNGKFHADDHVRANMAEELDRAHELIATLREGYDAQSVSVEGITSSRNALLERVAELESQLASRLKS